MEGYALNNFSIELEKIRKGATLVDDYDMDLSGVFPQFEETKNPYEMDIANLFVSSMEDETKEKENPYIIDLTDLFKDGIQVKEPRNPYELDLTDLFKEQEKKNPYEFDLDKLFPAFDEVQYNPYTMDIKSLSRKEEIHIKQSVSTILVNHMEYQLNNTKQEQEAVKIILDQYGITMEKIKSNKPAIIKLGNVLYVPIDFLDRIEQIFRQNNIIVD